MDAPAGVVRNLLHRRVCLLRDNTWRVQAASGPSKTEICPVEKEPLCRMFSKVDSIITMTAAMALNLSFLPVALLMIHTYST